VIADDPPVKTKTLDTPKGRFVWRRFVKPRSVHCDRCEKDKASSTVAQWQRPGAASWDTLCNGCYGEVLSKP
jgi:hypothetical protein